MTEVSQDENMDGKGSGAEKTEPGASRHGNFINYYQFHPADERVRQLPRGVWRSSHPDRKYIALDIGCNAGDLSYSLYTFLGKNVTCKDEIDIALLGVDLDPILIERAKERNPQQRHLTFQCFDFLSENREIVLREYLKAYQRTRFDVAFCFSITMWIHLNNGDVGLKKFLEVVCDVCDMIVVEPQLWKCYKNAARRLKRANAGNFPLLKTLEFKDDVAAHIEDILSKQCGFRRLTVTTENEWQRKLLIYERNAT